MATTQPRTNRRRDTRKLFDWLNQVKADREVTPSAFLVAFEIGQGFNAEYGGAAWPSSLTIAKAVGLSEPSIIRIVRQLAQRGHLKIDPGKQGAGHSNRYFMVLKTSTSEGFRTAQKTSIRVKKTSTGGYDLSKNHLQGDAKASPQGERENGSRALTVIPVSAPAPVGGALEGKEGVDRFSDLWALWSSARSWPDNGWDELAARQSFVITCREADPDVVIAAARAWVGVVEGRYLSTLAKWLLGRGWLKRPPARRQRNGKDALARELSEFSSQWGLS
jgi:Helix-turn-helix domain